MSGVRAVEEAHAVAAEVLEGTVPRFGGFAPYREQLIRTCAAAVVAGLHQRGLVAYKPTSGVQDEGALVSRDELLTEDEHEALDLTAQLAVALRRVVGEGPAWVGDYTEAVAHLHALQHMIMAQAAARAFPERYRLLGGGRGGGL